MIYKIYIVYITIFVIHKKKSDNRLQKLSRLYIQMIYYNIII